MTSPPNDASFPSTHRVLDAPRCPTCGATLDAATHAFDDQSQGDAPVAGDATLCAYCGEFLLFETLQDRDGALGLSVASIEALDVERRPIVLKMQAEVRARGFRSPEKTPTKEGR